MQYKIVCRMLGVALLVGWLVAATAGCERNKKITYKIESTYTNQDIQPEK